MADANAGAAVADDTLRERGGLDKEEELLSIIFPSKVVFNRLSLSFFL